MGSINSTRISVFSELTSVNEVKFKRQDSNNWSLESKFFGKKNEISEPEKHNSYLRLHITLHCTSENRNRTERAIHVLNSFHATAITKNRKRESRVTSLVENSVLC